MKTKQGEHFKPKKKAVAKSRTPKKVVAPRRSLNEILKPFIGIAKDLPPDFAENHKLYASGAKKWK
jgi:hypothetical protein